MEVNHRRDDDDDDHYDYGYDYGYCYNCYYHYHHHLSALLVSFHIITIINTCHYDAHDDIPINIKISPMIPHYIP